MAPHGLLCTITDVKELHEWHMAKCDAHPYFVRVPDDEVPSYVDIYPICYLLYRLFLI